MKQFLARRDFLKDTAALSLASLLFGRLFAAKPADGSRADNPQIIPQNADTFARIFRVGQPARVEIPLSADTSSELNSVLICNDDGYALDGSWGEHGKPVPFRLENSRLIIDTQFPREGRYAIRLRKAAKKGENAKLQTHFVYALAPDLYALRPFKGDFHMHSTISDGKDSPEEMGLASLRQGMDFLALSDHRKYEGSEHLQKAFANIPVSMRLYNAEEVHFCTVHVHSFGARESVTQWVKAHKDEFDADVAQRTAALPADMSDADKRNVATAEVLFDVIRKLGGLAGFDHPYWRTGNTDAIYLNDTVRDRLFEDGRFDYFEMVNNSIQHIGISFTAERNAAYREKGIRRIGVGASDAHRIDNVGKAYSLCFSPSDSIADIQQAIREGRVVACDSSDPKNTNLYGDLRLIRYAEFLLESYYPTHDALCAAQERPARACLSGDTAAAKQLRALAQQLADYRQKYVQ